MITKGTPIQPRYGHKLVDARAESAPFMGRLPGDDPREPERLLIRWSHQASANDRHWCLGALSSFTAA
jgi:hypothetical protein